MRKYGVLLGVVIGIAAFSLFPPPKAAAILAVAMFCYTGLCIALAPEKQTTGRRFATPVPGHRIIR